MRNAISYTHRARGAKPPIRKEGRHGRNDERRTQPVPRSDHGIDRGKSQDRRGSRRDRAEEENQGIKSERPIRSNMRQK